jgi:signal transduction histidine kinase
MNDVNLPFKVHPRVFSALGAELVTDDIVAVIELVKNSYDAFAQRVLVSLGFGTSGRGNSISITDNGCGMDRSTIEDVWCTLATPYKVNQPFSQRDDKKRRVTGAKGLGRLSAARLGGFFEMITKSDHDLAWKVTVDWDSIKEADGISACKAHLEQYSGDLPFGDKDTSGTSVTISNLTSAWDTQMVSLLKENLARLRSPFAQQAEFEVLFSDLTDTISFDAPEDIALKYRIEPSKFLLQPKYRIKGTVNESGGYTGKYEFRQIGSDSVDRQEAFAKEWSQIYRDFDESIKDSFDEKIASCGPFEFEIRAWDIGTDDISEIAEKFSLKQKSKIRKDIAAHKGISVYRDEILVLPKTDTARDWLKLDLRRVSRVGNRLSTSQIIGYISITADGNRNIKDSSDREKLQQNRASMEFESIIRSIIHDLEQARDKDRNSDVYTKEKPLKELFESFSRSNFITEYQQLAEEGALAKDLLPILEERYKEWEKASEEIKRRFIYYSRMATVGTIAEMLIHEIRNNTTSIGRFLRLFAEEIVECSEDLNKYHSKSTEAIRRLETLADTFSPLANRTFVTKRRNSDLLQRIQSCFDLNEKEIQEKGVILSIPNNPCVMLSIDPAELDAILLNLISNALYWISDVEEGRRTIDITAVLDGSRVRIAFNDSGPGIKEEYVERVFQPGVTAKTNGIGMGLTVASELVAEYGGRMSVLHPGKLGGATFVFDLPAQEGK